MDITSKLAGYLSLSKDTNKVKNESDETVEGVVGDFLPELELSMSDDELTDLTAQWRKKWNDSPKKAQLEKAQKENEKYWLGKHFDDVKGDERPLVDNLIFESLEEALPVATKENPEPVVATDNTDEGKELASVLQKMLVYLTDHLALKLRLKRATRYWAIYLLGVVKISWSVIENEMALQALRPQKLILDPDATIDDTGEYDGEYIGEVRSDTAGNLKHRFPKQSKFIDLQSQGKDGTELAYTEWWTNDYVCWEMEGEILGKSKNPHFNYNARSKDSVDEMGNPTQSVIPARNHFVTPKMPYTFLSIFNLGQQPFDNTSLIGQNLALQDLVNKRLRQIDKNVDKMNGGSVWSSDVMTSEQAKQADDAIRNGGSVLVPGDVNRNHTFTQANSIPSDVFGQMNDTRSEMRNIFGTRGLGASGISQEQTVRGKIMVSQSDSSRIGGGITEYLEQFADRILNQMVQFIYVYWDTKHEGSVVGQAKAFEYVQLESADLNKKVTVSIKPGSLIPKDALTEANQAVDLATAGLLDPISLYTKLDFPNPKETAQNLFLWKTNPMMLFPELAQQMQAQQQAQSPQQGQPGNVQTPPQGNPADQDAAQATPSLSQVPINAQTNSMPKV